VSDLLPSHFCSAVIDKDETDAVCLAMACAGAEPLFSDAMPQFNGFGEGKSYLHQEAEQKLFGKTLPSWMQNRGTCVSMGSGRAMQDALYSALAFGGNVGKPIQLCFETIYGGSRIQIGHGKLGSGDGSIGAWAAQYLHDFGLLARAKYGSIDLSSAREDLAVQWGSPRAGVPASLLSESSTYKSPACMKCTTVANVRDALIARCGVWRCANRATHGQRSADGVLRPVSSGGHCQELAGWYIDIRGNERCVEQQSWGATSGPVGGGPFKLQDGREIMPREGSCAIFPEDIETYLREGEIWAAMSPTTPWQDPTLKPSEIV
jgi:hypothetical protein